MDTKWLPWSGGECPVEGNILVDVIHRDGEEHYQVNPGDECGAACVWSHHDDFGDIIFWRVSER